MTVAFDVKAWFHGVDFAQLEMVGGFEHMVYDHLPESVSLAVDNP
jgi:hypothetical protein